MIFLGRSSRVNLLAQQASSYVVSQGVFWVASVSLVEHRYALRRKGKTILEDSDQLRDKEKPIPGNVKRLPSNTDRLSGKTKPESGRIESEPRPSYGCGLWEELEPISGEEDNEESITNKSESGNIGSPIDKEKMELMKEYDSVKGGDMIRTD
jgi:hypothetical protein